MTKQMSRAELNVLLATTHASIRRIETGRNLGLTVDDWSRIQREARRNKTLEQRRAEFQAEVKEGKRLACAI
jgi:tRNA U34 5-carboxymethylaminomethyl modifying enzyme MnmG/GidA